MDQRTTLEIIPESHPCAPLPPPLNAIPNYQCVNRDFQTMLDVTPEPHSLNALSSVIPDQPTATVAALLDRTALRSGVPAAMLRTVTVHLARYIRVPAIDLWVGVWDAELPRFAAYLVK